VAKYLARLGLAALIAATTAGLAAGCTPDPRQTTVIPAPDAVETLGEVTPLERGKLRREALEDIQKGLDAWASGDEAGMREYFNDDQLKAFAFAAKKHKEKGTVRVHLLEDQTLSATEMTPNGKEVSARFVYTNKSYTQDKDGKRITKPTNKETEAQIGAEKVGDTWKIIRVIGSGEFTQ
jgi:predicted lipid-binding transport protein (Tim44 family)